MGVLGVKVCVYQYVYVCYTHLFITHYINTTVGVRFTLADDRKRLRTEHWETTFNE